MDKITLICGNFDAAINEGMEMSLGLIITVPVAWINLFICAAMQPGFWGRCLQALVLLLMLPKQEEAVAMQIFVLLR